MRVARSTRLRRWSRRQVLQSLGLAGAGAVLGCVRSSAGSAIAERVQGTVFIDTHEHLPDEVDRLAAGAFPCDDWSLLLWDYLSADLQAAGMPQDALDRFFSDSVDPELKWKLLEPFWPRVRHTGFGQALEWSIRQLYGIDALTGSSVQELESAYRDLRRPGFYDRVLIDTARIESCQVNAHGLPFHESGQPTLLMQDLSFQNLYIEPDIEELSSIAGIAVSSLDDWNAVIHWWFDTYSPYAVAAKTQGAYLRPIHHRRVAPELAEPPFARLLAGQELGTEERRLLEDHLFWTCTDMATRYGLPVKIHTGYLAGDRLSQFRRIGDHAANAVELCRKGPETTFVFLHIGYPHWQEFIAVAKRFANAHLEMSWAWALAPAAAREFLKRYLVTAPVNKVLAFGGDCSVVESVTGHAELARRGIARALAELVQEGWMVEAEALELIEPLMRGNAVRIFRLEEKKRRLSQAPWL